MSEIIIILLCVCISVLPTGYLIKHNVADVPKINEPVYERKPEKSKEVEEVLNSSAELDMEMFNGLQKDIQEILLKYL